MENRETFCRSSCVFYSTLSAGIESMEFGNTHQQRRRMRIEHQFNIRDASHDRQPKIQSSPVRETLERIMGQTNNDCRFQIPTPATFAWWKTRFKTGVCTCSQFLTEATHWIKEVEMVDSVDDLKSSSSVRGIQMPNFEVLDARIASALKKSSIILLSKEESVLRNNRPRSRTGSFAVGRLLT